MTQWLSLTALDTLFFRGPERFDAEAGGGAYLSSLFPPHPGTVFAAINSALHNGTSQTSDATFEHDDGPRASPGHYASRGPWLHHATHGLLLPAPLSLVADGQGAVHTLRPSAHAYQTDLGKAVHLPVAPATVQNIQAVADAWLPLAQYQAWLDGNAPQRDHIVHAKDLWATERHTGLARSRENRTAIEGQLYSAAHIRPDSQVSLLVHVPSTPQSKGWSAARHLPLGGEGRAVWVDSLSKPEDLPRLANIAAKDGKLRYTLCLITPGLGAAWGVLPGQAVREGVPGSIVCCALGRPLRIGGFDTKLGMPERVRSARAAGCVWWIEADATDLDAVRKLHNTCIGAASTQGYGHVMVGAWPAQN
jgi:CRISPR-associated protein Cmr3